MATIVAAIGEEERSGFAVGDFEHTAQLLTSGDDAVVSATLSNNFNIILAALRTAANAERDCADMRRMQALFIAADHDRNALLGALMPFANPPLYVFDEEAQFVPQPMPDDWIGGGWISTDEYRKARATFSKVSQQQGSDATGSPQAPVES